MFEETLRLPCFVFLRRRGKNDDRFTQLCNYTRGRERERERERAALDFFVGYPVRQLFFSLLVLHQHWKQQREEDFKNGGDLSCDIRDRRPSIDISNGAS